MRAFVKAERFVETDEQTADLCGIWKLCVERRYVYLVGAGIRKGVSNHCPEMATLMHEPMAMRKRISS